MPPHLFAAMVTHVWNGRPDARIPRLHGAFALVLAIYPIEVALCVDDHQVFALPPGNGVHPGVKEVFKKRCSVYIYHNPECQERREGGVGGAGVEHTKGWRGRGRGGGLWK